MKKLAGLIFILLLSFFFIPFMISIPKEIVIKQVEREEMKYDTYNDLGIVSPKKPQSTHLMYEHSDGSLYMVDSVDNTTIIKSEDKGKTWEIIVDKTHDIHAFFPDRTYNRLYFIYSTTTAVWSKYIDLDDDVEYEDLQYAQVQTDTVDVIRSGTTTWNSWLYDGVVDHAWIFHEEATVAYKIDMGLIGARTYAMTQQIVRPSYLWFLWKWSNENVEIWKWEIGTNNYTEMEDCGAGTALPDNKNQWGLSYDGSDIIYFILKDTGDSKHYLWSYVISSDTLTKLSEYNIALMLDRNTAAGVQEKGFHLTEYKIYQFQSNTTQLYLISIVDTDSVFIGITDNFLMNNDGDVFELEDQINKLINVNIIHEMMEAPHAIVMLKQNQIILEEDVLMKFQDNYTSAGSTSEEIVFEGKITNLTETPLQVVTLESPAENELKKTKPNGTYSGRSDEILTDVLADFTHYITKGTFSTGTAMGTIEFGGFLSLEVVLDCLAYFEGWVWYLDPTGKLFFNDGTVDSGVNLSNSTHNWDVIPQPLHPEYNAVKVNGAYIDGILMTSEWKENLESIQLIGRKELPYNIPFLNTVALCNIAAINILTRLSNSGKQVKYKHLDPSVGFILPGETVTFEHDKGGVTVASDQFIIKNILYNHISLAKYTIWNEL